MHGRTRRDVQAVITEIPPPASLSPGRGSASGRPAAGDSLRVQRLEEFLEWIGYSHTCHLTCPPHACTRPACHAGS